MASMQLSQDQLENMVRHELTKGMSFTINQAIIEILGMQASCVLGLLMEMSALSRVHHPENDGWFAAPIVQQKLLLNATEGAIQAAKKQLMDNGILLQVRQGIPYKYYYKINYVRLFELLS